MHLVSRALGCTPTVANEMAVSWAGMFYLTLFLCSKFSVTIPYLFPSSSSAAHARNSALGLTGDDISDDTKNESLHPHDKLSMPLRKQAAAPPAYLFILPLIPISIAMYVASTRYSDFRHHGFDIIFGALLGITMSTISFRMYHLPIRRGAGWSWGPRSVSKAFFVGMGVQGYSGEDGPESRKRDLEAGRKSGNAPLTPSMA